MRKALFILIIFVLINVVLQVLFLIKDTFIDENQLYRRYGKETVLKAYPDLSEGMVTDLLEHTWNREIIFDSTCYFKEAPYQSDYVNVSDRSMRFGDLAPEFPLKNNLSNVFVFGGSTTFGYGQPDRLTIPALLDQALPNAKVYNTGAAFYYSTQEHLRLKSLLKKGIKPDYAVFIDGLNEFDYPDDTLPHIASQLRPSIGNKFKKGFLLIPVVRLVHGVYTLFSPAQTGSQISASEGVSRYLQNKRAITAICQQHNISILFVIQPTPFYRYDRQYHLFEGEPAFAPSLVQGYQHLSDSLANDSAVLWLADMQAHDTTNNYVDLVHYTAAMHQRIAERIAKKITLTR